MSIAAKPNTPWENTNYCILPCNPNDAPGRVPQPKPQLRFPPVPGAAGDERRAGAGEGGGDPRRRPRGSRRCTFWGGPREGARSKGKAAAASVQPPVPPPGPAAAGRSRGRDPGRLAPHRPHAHRAVHDLQGWALALEGLIGYLRIIWCEMKGAGRLGGISVNTHGINSACNFSCRG